MGDTHALPPVSRRLRPLQICTLTAFLAMAPAVAVPQSRGDLGNTLQKLTAALAGEGGGTRAQVDGALEAVTRALSLWDARIASTESQLRSALVEAAPREAAQRRVTLGAMYFERGRFTEAASELSEATHLDSSQQAAWVLLALTLERLGQSASARDVLTTGMAAKADDPVLAYLLSRLTPPDDFITGARTTEILLNAASRLRANPVGWRVPFVDASVIDDRAPLQYQFLPAGYGVIVVPLLASRQYDAACKALRDLIAHDPLLDDPALLSSTFAAAALDLAAGRPDAALTRLAADSSLQTSSELHRLRAVALSHTSDPLQAITELETAVRLGPRNERAVTALVKALREQGQAAKAERVAAQAQTLLRDSAEIAWLQAQLYAALGRETDMIGALERAIHAQPLVGAGLLWSTLAQLRTPHFEPGAGDAFVHDVDLNPNEQDAHVLLGEFRRLEGRLDEASAEFAAAVLIQPDSVRAHLDIGLTYLATDRAAEAIATLRWVVARAPVLPGARYALANALLRTGHADEAAVELEAFKRLQVSAEDLSRRSQRLGSLNFQVSVLPQAGSCEPSIALYEQMIELDPANATHHLTLADCLVRLGRDQRAAESLERAGALGAPPFVFRRLADIYLRLGRDQDSHEAARQYEVRQQNALRTPSLLP